MLPRNYMLTAPADALNTDAAFGTGIEHTLFVKRLRECNPKIHVPLPDSYPHWYPGKAAGMTTIWLGQPFSPTGQKVCAFHIGVIPEFTQIDADGTIFRRGWRAILEKCIKSRAIDRYVAERIFNTTLDYSSPDELCWKCRMEGRKKPLRATSRGPLCEWHQGFQRVADTTRERNKESKWLDQQAPHRREQYLTPPLRPMVRVRQGRKSCLRMDSSPSPAKRVAGKSSSLAARTTKSG